ncbi:hypothetical protein ABK040_001632 [Willaertia magna]
MSSYSTESFYTSVQEKSNTVFFYLHGVVATSQNPFKILIDDKSVLKEEKNVDSLIRSVEVEESRASGIHSIRMKVDCPLLRLGNGLTHHYEKYDLTHNGYFFLIDCTGELLTNNSESQIRVIQQRHDNFGSEFQGWKCKIEDQKTRERIATIEKTTKNVIRSTLPPKDVEEQLKKLEGLFRKGILTKEEFETKWRLVYPTVVNNDDSDEGLTKEQEEMLAKLQSLVDKGIISEEEFELKKQKILGENNGTKKQQQQPQEPELTQEQKDMLTKLKHFLDRGILTQDEYELKVQQVYDGARINTPVTPTKAPSPTSTLVNSTKTLTPVKGNNDSLSEPEYKQRMEEINLKLNETQRQQLKTLDRFLNQGIIKKEEFEKRKQKIMGPLYIPTNWEVREKEQVELVQKQKEIEEQKKKQSQELEVELSQEQLERIEKLKKLKDRFIITETIFEAKKQQIINEGKKEVKEDFGDLTSDQRNKIAKLQHLRKLNIVSLSEYVTKLREIVGEPEGKKETTTTQKPPVPTQKPPKPQGFSTSPKPPQEQKQPPVVNTETKPIKKGPPPVAPKPTTKPVVKEQKQEEPPKDEVAEQLEKLRSLVKSGVISEEDYALKEAKLLGKETPRELKKEETKVQQPKEEPPKQVEKVVPKEEPKVEVKPVEEPKQTTQENPQIIQLRKLKDMGILTEEEFEIKVGMVLGKSKPKEEVPPVSTSTVQSTLKEEPKVTTPKVQPPKEEPKQEIPKEEPPKQVEKVIPKEEPKVEVKPVEPEVVPQEQAVEEEQHVEEQRVQEEEPQVQEEVVEEHLDETQTQVTSGEMPALTEEQLQEIEQLRIFLEEGLIDPEDFEEEKARILCLAAPSEEEATETQETNENNNASEEQHLTDEQLQQIEQLKTFLVEGLIDMDDFEEEKKKILSGTFYD